MKIAIASGKGGTGKTTIATNLALYVARMGQQVQYIDCDVEEPNGHIFLKPKINLRQEVTVDVPRVELDKCTGCGKCGELCQYSSIVCLGTNVLVFEQLCHSCGGCWEICPDDAIRKKPLAIGDIDVGGTSELDFVQGKLRIGSVRTPALVREVKRHAQNGHLTIIDVPPGTSCPVVEALKGVNFVLLVTEPTPFGLNDLKLAVGLVREMKLPFAVSINRYGIGDEEVEKYCESENIEIALKLADDRCIAEAYSTGQMVIDVLDEYREQFLKLYEYLKSKSKG